MRLRLVGIWLVLSALASIALPAAPWWRLSIADVLTGAAGVVMALALGIVRWNAEVARPAPEEE